MATFQQKLWVDRVSEYPTRRVLTDVSTEQTQTVTVTRSEGQVSSEGDAFNATNMNDLEERISNVVNDITEAFQAGVDAVYDALVAIGIRPSASTPEAIARAIATVGSGNATANQILSGKTAYASHNLLTGTMTNRGNWTSNTSGSGNITIPQGYHAGGGYVNCSGAYTAGERAGGSTQKDLDHTIVNSKKTSMDTQIQTLSTRVSAREGQTLRPQDASTIMTAANTMYENYIYLLNNI